MDKSAVIRRIREKELDTLIAERRLYSGNLAEFTRAACPAIEPGADLIWNWHLDAICAYLEAFSRGVLRAAARLLGTTDQRFALHGRQRLLLYQ